MIPVVSLMPQEEQNPTAPLDSFALPCCRNRSFPWGRMLQGLGFRGGSETVITTRSNANVTVTTLSSPLTSPLLSRASPQPFRHHRHPRAPNRRNPDFQNPEIRTKTASRTRAKQRSDDTKRRHLHRGPKQKPKTPKTTPKRP